MKNFVKEWRRDTILTNKYIITFSNYFYDEIKYIFDYINFRLKEPVIAKDLYNKIIYSIYSLEYFPQRYPKINNFKNQNFHKLIVSNYIIIYEIDNSLNQVLILHIFHNTQNYLNFL